MLCVKRLSTHAQIPSRGSDKAAGYDLYSAVELTIPAGKRALVGTDIAIQLPQKTYGRIAPRSGLALKNGINVGAGVIDEDYTGPIGVLLFNHGDKEFKINPGDRIAQLIIETYWTPPIKEVNQLVSTVRGDQGFGSTGC